MANVAASSRPPVADATADATSARGRVLGAAVAGYAFDAVDLMVIALTLPLLLADWKITMVQGGVIVSAMLVGGCIGGYVFGPLADKFGRKRALMWCIAFFGICTGLGGFAQDYIQLAVARFLAGIGLGAEWALGATMVAEFYPANKRAKANAWMQMGWPLGYGFAIAAQYALVPTYGWRALYFVGAGAVFVALYLWLFVPESPVWLKAQEAKREAAAGTVVQAAAPANRPRDLFKPPYLRAYGWTLLLLVSALAAYWAINSWLPTILGREKGMDNKAMSTFLLALNVISVPAYFIAGPLGDKFGKRLITYASAAVSAVTLYAWLAFDWSPAVFWGLGLLHWATASGMWAGLAAFVAEQFPTNIRALALSSAFSTGRVLVVFIPMALGAAAMTTGMTTVMAFVGAFYLIAAIGAYMLRDATAEL